VIRARKPAERIADRRVVVSVSGGKDSAATSLYLTELGIPHERVFADTGWEHPLTYAYLRGELTARLGPIRELRAERTFPELVRHKGIFPDRTKRFCTVELKVKPIFAYLESLDEDAVNVIGVRRDESRARANVPEWEDSRALMIEVWRPIFDWTLADVIAIHKRHGLAPNPLYGMGATRVGCWPCIHARQSELVLVADTDPGRIAEIDVLEREVTDAATRKASARGESLKWARSMFSARDTKATPDGTRLPMPEEIANGTYEAAASVPVFRRKHRPLPIFEAVRWARAGVARKDPEEPSTSCGEWGFCE
jgi:3'-phosphoadenosine 5'-phosphosulfate sulfotransferase (PAPS reductase)/FAD synthetase